MNEELEVLDVVDSNDQVIGTVQRKDYGALPANHFIRFSEIFIQRPDGAIWLPRRSMTKKIAPGGLDMSAAGHVLSGETYEDAAVREIAEETGLTVQPTQLKEIRTLPPGAVPCFRKLFLITTDQHSLINSSEHIEGEWVPANELGPKVHNDVPTKETLYENIEILTHYLREK